ncbi:sensor histidine kinase [Anaerosacchariphilus polymeriproducens]|uniref:histidine kinase n=1 Tax=Anaerosacchariphilus polymeriproducens TaxID=1812858 RepID=A0A371AYI8_9FIRM|nr:sensor histidine kinase [Anaerosacchariphilus polymeriproducens]RDU24654.1 sensor histidine kinase [Anaerosacchariphilus polymeriproducens]
MSFINFLNGRKSIIVLHVIGMIVLYSYLSIFDIPKLAVFFIVFMWAIVFLIYLIVTFIKRRSYFTHLQEFIENSTDLNSLANSLRPPENSDMKIFFDYIQRLNEDIEEKMDAIKNKQSNYQEYIESWVHDVKTPIAAIKLIIETDLKGISYEELLEEANKIEHLVEQTLYFARSENVEKDYFIKEIPVMKCVKSAIEDNAVLIERKGITMEVKNSGETVISDEKWLRFIFNQIFINAIKYSKKDSPYIKIWVDRKNESVILNIEDNGIGIPKKDIDRIFNKGFTGESGRKYEKSTGMGLYLVKKLCMKLGHDVYVQSSREKFTKVSIAFPKNKI